MKKTVSIIFFISVLFNQLTQAQVKNLTKRKDVFEGSVELQSVRISPSRIAFISEKKGFEINCVDNMLTTKWTASIAGGLLQEATVLGSRLLVIISGGKENKEFSTFTGYLFDSETGKLVAEKTLFAGKKEFLTIPYMQVAKDNKRLMFATRETSFRQSAFMRQLPARTAGIKVSKEKIFNVMSFDENLELKSTVSPALPMGDFIGIQQTNDGDIYVALSEPRKGVTLTKYPAGTAVSVKTIIEPSAVFLKNAGPNRWDENMTLSTDTLSNNLVYLSGTYPDDKQCVVFITSYNFSSGAINRFVKSFDKDAIEAVEKSYVPLNKNTPKKMALAKPRMLNAFDIAVTPSGCFLLMGDSRKRTSMAYTPPTPPPSAAPAGTPGSGGGWSSRSSISSEGLMMLKLSGDLKLQTITPIPRSYTSDHLTYTKLLSEGTDLYVLASNDKKGAFLLGKVSMTTGKLDELLAGDPGDDNNSDYAGIEMATLANKELIMPVIDRKMSLSMAITGVVKSHVHLYRMGW